MKRPFHIYRSSAGSGKTRMLAREYIRLSLRHPTYFRHLLAMTFTNKSTQEMKDRIIHYLSDFAEGRSEDLAAEIIEEQRKEGYVITPVELKEKSSEILSLLLHQYGEFSISTLDAFFQRIIRSFTRETGLLGNFKLELDNALVMDEVIALLMDQLKDNAELRSWVLDFSMEKLLAGENWDIRIALTDFAKLIEKEEFKVIEESVLRTTANKSFFKLFREKLNKEKSSIEHFVAEKATRLLKEFHNQHLAISDFKYGTTGSVYSYVQSLINEIKEPKSRIDEAIESSRQWPSPNTQFKELIIEQAEASWRGQLKQLTDFILTNLELYKSIDLATDNLYAFGLLSDIVRTQRAYLSSENLMLLSDAPKFLNKLMQEQDTSFVYEKVGSFYRHFLLDEFQDTSGLQWNNLLPLIQNGLAQNYSSLIVGDVKQSIYRWRGGDLAIIKDQLKKDIHETLQESHTLDTNYRSDENIINFNNAIFKDAAKIIAEKTGSTFPEEVYEDAIQKVVAQPSSGYVKIQFLETIEEKSFEEDVLERLPSLLEDLQDQGVSLKDIAFLVRDNKEGRLIANRFMEYRTSQNNDEVYRYDVVSNESLLIDRSPSVMVLINALKMLENPEDMIARANLAVVYQKLWPSQAFLDLNEIFIDARSNRLTKWIPSVFIIQASRLLSLALFEMVENLISIFNLGSVTEEVIYIQSFQDIVLEFMQRERNDISAFLDWWELNKEKKSIQVAGGVDAAQIITIHRAKGLQFKYVIIPFLNWPLDHSNKEVFLWCKSDYPLFKDVGFLPLRYKKELAQTFFKEAYQNETRRVHLDNLNLLYVAFTRSEKGLVAFAPLMNESIRNPDKGVAKIGQLVDRVIQGNSFLLEGWSSISHTYEMGKVQPSLLEIPDKTLTLRSYQVIPWRDRLYVRTKGMEFFKSNQSRKKINYGIFIHSILSQIRVKKDVAKAIETAIQSGRITEKERGEVKDSVNWVTDLPALSSCFQESVMCKTEVSLFAQDGTERIIDRIVMKGDQAWILDYKSGEPTPKDEKQVKEYIQLVKSMGKRIVKGYLVYLQERRCVEIAD